MYFCLAKTQCEGRRRRCIRATSKNLIRKLMNTFIKWNIQNIFKKNKYSRILTDNFKNFTSITWWNFIKRILFMSVIFSHYSKLYLLFLVPTFLRSVSSPEYSWNKDNKIVIRWHLQYLAVVFVLSIYQNISLRPSGGECSQTNRRRIIKANKTNEIIKFGHL